MKKTLQNVKQALELLKQAEQTLQQQCLELRFHKKEHGGILEMSSLEGGESKQIKVPETSFMLLCFLLYYQQEFSEIIPYHKLQAALQDLRNKNKVPLATLRAEISRTNDILKRSEIPILIQSKREKGYSIIVQAGTVKLDEEYQKTLMHAAWKVCVGEMIGEEDKQKEAMLRISRDETEFHEISNRLLQDPDIHEVLCLKDNLSLFSVPMDCAYTKDQQAIEALQKRKDSFNQRLQQGLVYREIITKKHFVQYLKALTPEQINSQVNYLKQMAANFSHYYLFPTDTQLPMALMIFEYQFAFLTANSWSDYNENVYSLFMAGKNCVMIARAIFDDIYNSAAMTKWRNAENSPREHYQELLDEWLDKTVAPFLP